MGYGSRCSHNQTGGGIVCAGGFLPDNEFDLTSRSLLAFTPSLKDELAVLAQHAG